MSRTDTTAAATGAPATVVARPGRPATIDADIRLVATKHSTDTVAGATGRGTAMTVPTARAPRGRNGGGHDMSTMPTVAGAGAPATAIRGAGIAGQVRILPHAVDPRVPRPPAPPARRDLFATYLDHMRRRVNADAAAPHHAAHADFCTRLRIPENIAESLWGRWLRHYLRYGPDWS